MDNSWNRALEAKDIKALDLLLDDTLKSVDIDGSVQSKTEFLASIKAPDYHPPAHAVTEQSSVEVYGDSAVVVGIFRTTGVDKGKKYAKRERFVWWTEHQLAKTALALKFRLLLIRFASQAFETIRKMSAILFIASQGPAPLRSARVGLSSTDQSAPCFRVVDKPLTALRPFPRRASRTPDD